jgi:hypothetical protein
MGYTVRGYITPISVFSTGLPRCVTDIQRDKKKRRHLRFIRCETLISQTELLHEVGKYDKLVPALN